MRTAKKDKGSLGIGACRGGLDPTRIPEKNVLTSMVETLLSGCTNPSNEKTDDETFISEVDSSGGYFRSPCMPSVARDNRQIDVPQSLEFSSVQTPTATLDMSTPRSLLNPINEETHFTMSSKTKEILTVLPVSKRRSKKSPSGSVGGLTSFGAGSPRSTDEGFQESSLR